MIGGVEEFAGGGADKDAEVVGLEGEDVGGGVCCGWGCGGPGFAVEVLVLEAGC